jgi:hypothetical protein
MRHQGGTHELQRHTSKLILKSLLDRTSNHPGAMDVKVVLPLVKTHASISAGSAPNAATTFTGIPSDSRSTLINEEWRINTQLRLGLPLASYQPTARTVPAWLQAPADQGARQGAVRLPPGDRRL